MKKSIFNFLITIGCLGALVACSSEHTPLPPNKNLQTTSDESNRIDINKANDDVSDKINSLIDLMTDFELKDIQYNLDTTESLVDNGYQGCSVDGKSPSPNSNICELISKVFDHQRTDYELHTRIGLALRDIKGYLRRLTLSELEGIHIDIADVNSNISDKINPLIGLITEFELQEIQHDLDIAKLLVDGGYQGCSVNSKSSSPNSNTCESISKIFDHQKTDNELHIRIHLALRDTMEYLEGLVRLEVEASQL